MSLLMMIAIAMLNLSTVSTRGSSAEEDQLRARANARVALMMALSTLQETAGDDRRITADGSIISESAVSPHAVGVWESWTPGLSTNTQGTAPNYDTEKQSRFVRWLVSGSEETLTDPNWVTTTPTQEQIDLFGESTDGFKLQGTLVNTNNGSVDGGLAWAIAQENTKAKINVAGPELADRHTNDDLHAQPRPNVSQSGVFSQPTANWNERAAKVLDYRQATLDPDLAATGANTVGADFTTSSFGLLTNTVNGGLKVDMNLGFEMTDTDYNQDSWTTPDGETINNPFRNIAETAFSTPSNYDAQRPLYQPLVDSGSYSYQRTWGSSGGQYDDDVHFYFPVTSVPTFDTLRSFYRIPHHLYQTGDGVTIFERAGDHVAAVSKAEENIASSHNPPPHIAANGAVTQTAIRPVLDRVLYLFSLSLSPNNTPQYSITPVVTLWNPYNVALEIEGAVTYPWLDLPMYRRFWITRDGSTANKGSYISRDLQKGSAKGAVRQIPPYIFGAITADGNPISGNATPIRFEPGEVRIFVPASPVLQEFTALNATVRERTIFMRPVNSVSDYSITGGFNVMPQNDAYNDQIMKTGDSVRVRFDMSNSGNTGSEYPMSIALADATVAKGAAPSEETRGLVIADILADDFVDAYLLAGDPQSLIVDSPTVSFDTLQQGPSPVFSLEVYHRVAKAGTDAQEADLVYTGNPRQSSMNSFVTKTQFQTGPQYKVRMRAVSSSSDLLQIDTSGNRPAAYYGATQESGSGRSHLSFFEVPRAPLVSLAGFQHADLSSTPFAPANQFANSWASAYVPRDQVIDGNDGREVDHTYLVNEALWDGFFLSSAAPTLEPTTTSGLASNWNNSIANETKSLQLVLQDFADNSAVNPLRNPRMHLLKNTFEGQTSAEFANEMILPESCAKIAGHLMVDGAFNINSTSVTAWAAMLTGLRGSSFQLGDGATSVTVADTPFSRFRNPLGAENDNWQGFRSLTDTQIQELAENLVAQVRARGPFLSLSEFVNRRVEDSNLGLSGALQTAIDGTTINSSALQGNFDASKYDGSESDNVFPQDTGVGIPGYLTQADLLQSIAPVITPRSDTFTIRAYGEARDNNGNVSASVWIEATVQRYPNFVDKTDPSYTQTADLSAINQKYGREFRIVSFRYLAPKEAEKLAL
ncbi:MAG: hypothetical protein ACSHX6_16525 [Akkermansiaceae bacterium]